jgi:hypothetical protein
VLASERDLVNFPYRFRSPFLDFALRCRIAKLLAQVRKNVGKLYKGCTLRIFEPNNARASECFGIALSGWRPSLPTLAFTAFYGLATGTLTGSNL